MSQRSQNQVKRAPQAIFTPKCSSRLDRKWAGETPTLSRVRDFKEGSDKQLTVQRRAANQAEPSGVPSIVHEVLRSPGKPLDQQTRAFMEARFGHDFGRVRVHTDGPSAASARAVNARAYTVGQQIVFGERQYSASSESGRYLLAHELAHTVQQGEGRDSTNRLALFRPRRRPGARGRLGGRSGGYAEQRRCSDRKRCADSGARTE